MNGGAGRYAETHLKKRKIQRHVLYHIKLNWNQHHYSQQKTGYVQFQSPLDMKSQDNVRKTHNKK